MSTTALRQARPRTTGFKRKLSPNFLQFRSKLQLKTLGWPGIKERSFRFSAVVVLVNPLWKDTGKDISLDVR